MKMDFSTAVKLLLCTLLFISLYPVRCEEEGDHPVCSPGLKSIGYTVPSGDITLEHGHPLDIYCILYDKYVEEHGPNVSSSLVFITNNAALKPPLIDVVNSTTIRLHIDKPDPQSQIYRCSLQTPKKNVDVCLNFVIVGTKPKPVTDFDCLSYNYDNLTCTWTAPRNQVRTSYNLTYRLKGRSTRLAKGNCPVMGDPDKISRKMSCLWNVSTHPQYRLAHEQYYFTLTAKNMFGTYILEKTFEHFRYVLPNPPVNLTYVNKTWDSVLLHWNIPGSMHPFPPGLTHRVLLHCHHDPKDVWRLAGLFNGSDTDLPNFNKEIYFNVTGIGYPYTFCDIRVSMRSAYAPPEEERLWSKNATLTVRTAGKIPGSAPKTTVGSFKVFYDLSNGNHRNVFVYWRRIPETDQNGANYRVRVAVEDDSLETVDVYNQVYAKFNNLKLGKNYKFVIWSENDEGRSENNSYVYVPSQTDILNEPSEFTKISFGKGAYTLTWEKPTQGYYPYTVVNYTIFWCSVERESESHCDGTLRWVHVPHSKDQYNITVSDDEKYEFAIAANTVNSSSGMHWAACNVFHNTPSKLSVSKTGWGPTYVELSWKLDCADRTRTIKGYAIYYCQIISPSQKQCKEPEQTVTVMGDASLTKANVTNLTPYTTYRLSVATITKYDTYSQPSEPQFVTMLEGAPSSPLLTVRSVTNSSIAVSWTPPAITNGYIKYYDLYYNDDKKTVDHNVTEYVLENLTSYTVYFINVTACTTLCSQPSETATVTTKIGYPGIVDQPKVDYFNESLVMIQWDKPREPQGRNEIYQLMFKGILDDKSNASRVIINVTDTRYAKECNENTDSNRLDAFVRAVNVDENGELLKGPWSPELHLVCNPSSNYVIYLSIFMSTVILVILFFVVRKLWKHCKFYVAMPGPKLPTSLDPEMDPNEFPLVSNAKDPKDAADTANTDKEVLLGVNKESRNTDSGRGSSSSIGSSIHAASSSDSGIEPPPSASSENLLRQRNNISKAEQQTWTTNYVTLPTVGDASIVPDMSYVTAGPPQDTSKIPSVTCEPDFITESTEASQAYVVAGTKPIKAEGTMTDRSPYVQVADISHVKSVVEKQPPQVIERNVGYVSIGEASAHPKGIEHKGYVPHRSFEMKALKED